MRSGQRLLELPHEALPGEYVRVLGIASRLGGGIIVRTRLQDHEEARAAKPDFELPDVRRPQGAAHGGGRSTRAVPPFIALDQLGIPGEIEREAESAQTLRSHRSYFNADVDDTTFGCANIFGTAPKRKQDEIH